MTMSELYLDIAICVAAATSIGYVSYQCWTVYSKLQTLNRRLVELNKKAEEMDTQAGSSPPPYDLQRAVEAWESKYFHAGEVTVTSRPAKSRFEGMGFYTDCNGDTNEGTSTHE